MSKKRYFISLIAYHNGGQLLFWDIGVFLEIRVAAVKRDILLWAAVAAGWRRRWLCRIVPLVPRAQPGLIPFTADSSPR